VRDPFTKDSRGFGFVTMESTKEAEATIDELNKTEIDGKQMTIEISKRNRPHQPTPGAYLGPTSTSFKRTFRTYSPRRKHSRSRSRSYGRDRSYRRRSPYSRSRSNSYGRKK